MPLRRSKILRAKPGRPAKPRPGFPNPLLAGQLPVLMPRPEPKRGGRGRVGKNGLAAFLRSIDALPKLTFQTLPAPNCYFDAYRAGAAKIDGPTFPTNQGHLIAAFALGQEANEADARFQWTHVLLCPKTPKLRDEFPVPPGPGPFPPSGEGPRLYIGSTKKPQPWLQSGPIFHIVLVERLHRKTGREFQRVYLRRSLGVEK